MCIGHRESSVRIPLTAFTSLLFTPKDLSLCTRKCNIHDTPATIFLRYGDFPLVFHYHIHYHPTDVSKLENTAALSYHKRVDSYLPPSQVNVNTTPETQAITHLHHRFKIKETEVPQTQNYIVLLCRCVCARASVHVYIISYTHEKYLTITTEDGTAKAVLDKRVGNFLLLQKTVVNSSDKNCENLN
jgi:hypothetical protein